MDARTSGLTGWSRALCLGETGEDGLFDGWMDRKIVLGDELGFCAWGRSMKTFCSTDEMDRTIRSLLGRRCLCACE